MASLAFVAVGGFYIHWLRKLIIAKSNLSHHIQLSVPPDIQVLHPYKPPVSELYHIFCNHTDLTADFKVSVRIDIIHHWNLSRNHNDFGYTCLHHRACLPGEWRDGHSQAAVLIPGERSVLIMGEGHWLLASSLHKDFYHILVVSYGSLVRGMSARVIFAFTPVPLHL